MKTNFKSFASGFLVCAILMTVSVPIFAKVEEYILYKSECTIISSDGTKYADKDYPVLMYKGSNYVPVGKIAQFLGVDFSWEGNTKTATFKAPITTNKTDSLTINNVQSDINSTEPTFLYEDDDVKNTTYNEYKTIMYNKNTYINEVEFCKKLKISIKYSTKQNSYIFYKNGIKILETLDTTPTYYIVYEGCPYFNINFLGKYLEG